MAGRLGSGGRTARTCNPLDFDGMVRRDPGIADAGPSDFHHRPDRTRCEV